MLEQLQNIFAESFDLNTIEDDTSPENVEEWDSLAHVGLMVTLEAEFGVSISSSQAIELSDVGKIKAFLSSQGIK
jgi:acyl carrier protein